LHREHGHVLVVVVVVEGGRTVFYLVALVIHFEAQVAAVSCLASKQAMLAFAA
jgi:hypothetical protein